MQLRRALIGLVAGLVLSLATLGLMLLKNTLDQGFPLSPYRLEVLGLTLGRAAPELDVYAEEMAKSVTPEYATASAMAPFGIVGGAEVPSLGPLSLAWILGAVAGVVFLARRRFFVALLLFAVASAQMLLYLSPGFEAVRITHGASNGRFLHAFLVMCVLLTVSLEISDLMRRLIVFSMMLVVAMASIVNFSAFPSAAEHLPLLAGSVFLFFSVYGVSLAHTRFGSIRTGIGILIGFAILLVFANQSLRRYRDAIRYSVIESSIAGHRVDTYWAGLARLLDEPGKTHDLAITKGYSPTYAAGFTYYFLGRRLQNRLHYVSIRDDGATPVYLGPGPISLVDLSEEAWIERIREAGIHYVVSLRPSSVEADWMRERPDAFRRIVGRPGEFGLHQVLEKTGFRRVPDSANFIRQDR
jgi:hypothetical protein